MKATTTEQLQPRAPWVSLATNSAAWAAADPGVLDSMLTSMVLIRAFEEKVLELAGQGLVHGPAHSAVGQEGGAVGSVLAMRGSDQINGSHRAHHQFLAKALHYVAPQGLSSSAPFGDDVRTIADLTMSEILGLARGYTAAADKTRAIAEWEIVLKNIPPSQRANLPPFQRTLDQLKAR